MSETPIQPALDEREWRLVKLWNVGKAIGGKARGMVVLDLPPDHRKGAAALALYGQPFGFTREDVDDLEDAAMARFILGEARCVRLRGLMTRIAALLPPSAD